MDELVRIRNRFRGRFILAGDLNSRSAAWGSNKTNKRGNILLETVDEMNLIPVNSSGKFSFERNGRRSQIDIISADKITYKRIKSSKILTDDSGSDHFYLFHKISVDKRQYDDKMILETYTGDGTLSDAPPFMNYDESCEYIRAVHLACEAAMSKKNRTNFKKEPNPWWSDEISTLRKKLNKSRRLYQRAKKKDKSNSKILEEEYKNYRKKLKYKIEDGKKAAWKALCEEVEKDIWGRPYKVIMNKIKKKAPAPNISKKRAKSIIKALFPRSENEVEDFIQKTISVREELMSTDKTNYINDVYVTNTEVINAAKKLKLKKAAGIDGIPPSLIKWLTTKDTTKMTRMINGLLRESRFPEPWKVQRLVLIRKEGRDPSMDDAYRPLCIVDTWAKLVETILKDKLLKELGPKPFASNQFGFVKSRSTIDALEKLREITELANLKQKYVALVTIDVRNAFNSVHWTQLIGALEKRKVSIFLKAIIADYFIRREVRYLSSEGWISHKMSRGVPQGSILGPTLWNLAYDELLQIKIPIDCYIIGYADDVAIVVTSRRAEDLKKKIEQIMRQVNN